MGTRLFAGDESRIEWSAIGDAVVMAVSRHVQVRVRVSARDAIMAAVVVIHDMLMLV